MKSFKIRLLAMCLAVAAVAVLPNVLVARSKTMTTTTAVQRLQPFVSMQTSWDSVTAGGVGGIVRYYRAKSTDTLLICDYVAIDTLNGVTRASSTLANYNKAVGIVVGGRSTSMQASVSSSDCGQNAALPGRPVIVLREGRFWAQLDTTTGGITAGGLFGPSAINGKIRPKTAVLDSLFRVGGRAILGGAISTTVLIEVNAK